MHYIFGKQDMATLEQAQSRCFLLTNGLGGYASVTAAYSVPRCDQGLFVAAVKAPNVRITMVHRMRETLELEGEKFPLSAQSFADSENEEKGTFHLAKFQMRALPSWTYQVRGVTVKRTLAIAQGENTVAVRYEIVNDGEGEAKLALEPFLKFAPKEDATEDEKTFTMSGNRITDGTYQMYIHTGAKLEKREALWQTLAYTEDAKDGRPAEGKTGCCCRITETVAAGERKTVDVVFSLEEKSPSADDVLTGCAAYRKSLEAHGNFRDPLARELAAAADAFIVHRESTNCKTILAGYPLFSDWGRDTMIALPGCCLSTGRFEDAKSILRTFLAYEKDGLVPNLFPEGDCAPMYNTVDAALLLIDCVWQYVQRTGDEDFAREAWPVMEQIAAAYRRGTHHSISMDEDGLIRAGGGLDQVTWMDVCVNGILPTPRHGKPVEVNAYWYNALRILDTLAQRLNLDRKDYGALAEKVKASFIEKFYIPEKGYLRDVISGTSADEQIRCNQICAVSMPFTMLSSEQEKQVVSTVTRHLYTPCGLRTLSPKDPEYHPHYGGAQLDRDLAYHQGTTWVFPMGAYYLAYLKAHGNSAEAVEYVREGLSALEPMLREGCLGQLPEIYEGDFPSESKGCFGQAWSVGEMLRVFEALERL